MGFSNLPTIDVGAGGGIADPNTAEISPATFLNMVLAGTDPKVLFFQLASQALMNLPGWIQGCQQTDAKGRTAYDQLKQAEAGLISQQGLKPVVSVEPYDENPQPAMVQVEAVGQESKDSKPTVDAEQFVIGQNQQVEIAYDLRSEFWAPNDGCQGEWAWVKILCNQNGQLHTVWEKLVQAHGSLLFWVGSSLGESSGTEKMRLPAGQYVLLAVSTGGTSYKVTFPGLSYAKASISYSIPKPLIPFLGGMGNKVGAFVKKYWPWLLVGTGGVVGVGMVAKTLVGKRRKNDYGGRGRDYGDRGRSYGDEYGRSRSYGGRGRYRDWR